MTRTREENALDMMHDEYERKLVELRWRDDENRSYGEKVDDNLSKLDALNHALQLEIEKEHANPYEHKYNRACKKFMVTVKYTKLNFGRCDVFESDTEHQAKAVYLGLVDHWRELELAGEAGGYWQVMMWRKSDEHSRYSTMYGPGGHMVDIKPTNGELYGALDAVLVRLQVR